MTGDPNDRREHSADIIREQREAAFRGLGDTEAMRITIPGALTGGASVALEVRGAGQAVLSFPGLPDVRVRWGDRCAVIDRGPATEETDHA